MTGERMHLKWKLKSFRSQSEPKMKARATWKSCCRKEPGSYCRQRLRTRWPNIWKYTKNDEPMLDSGRSYAMATIPNADWYTGLAPSKCGSRGFAIEMGRSLAAQFCHLTCAECPVSTRSFPRFISKGSRRAILLKP